MWDVKDYFELKCKRCGSLDVSVIITLPQEEDGTLHIVVWFRCDNKDCLQRMAATVTEIDLKKNGKN